MGGYVLRITGGNDKQGFPMKQGILTNGRVRLLLKKGTTCYRPRKDGERKRKSVRGCIVDGNLSVLSMAIIKKGEADIPGLTDNTIPRRLGPKRASKIRKLFNLTKEDDVCQYVIKRPLSLKEGKKQKFAAPKVQRLVTPVMLQRKRHRLALKRRRGERTGWPPPSTLRSSPRGRRRPRKPRSSSAGGLLPFASPSTPCPASRRLILALHAEEINSRKPQ